MRTHSRRTGSLALALAAALAIAACGSDDDGDATSADTEAAVGTEVAADTQGAGTDSPGDTEAPTATGASADAEGPDDEGPQQIISLSPTHTEMLFAIGAGDRLVAVDDQSDHPAEALELPNELSGFEPNVEAIAAYEPDLVITGGDFTGLGEQLTSIGIEHWDGPAALSIDDTYAQITDLGEVTGRTEEAADLVAGMQADIDAIVAGHQQADPPLTYYHELDPSLYSVTSDTFIGAVYSLLGLRNVADQLETDAGPYPQLNAEFLVSADPDMIFLADTECCAQTAATVAERPGWGAIAAVETGAVFEMNDDVASRWGPRVVDYLRDVAEAAASVDDS